MVYSQRKQKELRSQSKARVDDAQGTTTTNNSTRVRQDSIMTTTDAVELQMSVASIKRVDPYVKAILAKSTHVALYRFNPAQNEWEKTDTEGALFLYSRNGEPYHSVMIMNRLNTQNQIEPIVREFDYQLQSPFLLYRNARNKIFGIWFYNRDECVNITHILGALMDALRDKPGIAGTTVETQSAQVQSCNDIMQQHLDVAGRNASGGAVDIFSMLSRAQEDFNNKTPQKSGDGVQLLTTANTTPFSSSTPRAPNVMPSQSVMDFFAKAGVKSASKAPVVAQEHPGMVVMQRLMTDPVRTVEHIEKQQRSVTPQQQQQPNSSEAVVAPAGGHPLMILRKSELTGGGGSDHAADELVASNGLAFIRAQSPNTGVSPLAKFLKQATNSNNSNLSNRNASLEQTLISNRNLTSPLASQLAETPQKLLPPMMFCGNSDTTKAGCTSNAVNSSTTAAPPLTMVDLSLLEQNKDIEPLTKKQMLQALNYLLKNDVDFVTKLHEAYVKSLTEKIVPMNLCSPLI